MRPQKLSHIHTYSHSYYCYYSMDQGSEKKYWMHNAHVNENVFDARDETSEMPHHEINTHKNVHIVQKLMRAQVCGMIEKQTA